MFERGTPGWAAAWAAAALLLFAAAAVAQPGRRTFVGKVLENHPGEGWFLMKGGSSKKYPQVKVLLDKKTRWTGSILKPAQLKPGQSVEVQAVPDRDNAFRALTVQAIVLRVRPATGLGTGKGP